PAQNRLGKHSRGEHEYYQVICSRRHDVLDAPVAGKLLGWVADAGEAVVVRRDRFANGYRMNGNDRSIPWMGGLSLLVISDSEDIGFVALRNAGQGIDLRMIFSDYRVIGRLRRHIAQEVVEVSSHPLHGGQSLIGDDELRLA